MFYFFEMFYVLVKNCRTRRAYFFNHYKCFSSNTLIYFHIANHNCMALIKITFNKTFWGLSIPRTTKKPFGITWYALGTNSYLFRGMLRRIVRFQSFFLFFLIKEKIIQVTSYSDFRILTLNNAGKYISK